MGGSGRCWKVRLGVFERGSKQAPEVDETQIKELHAKIGELTVSNDFLSRKLKPWGLT